MSEDTIMRNQLAEFDSDRIKELEAERDRLKASLTELEAQRFLCPDCEAPLKAIKRMDSNSYWVHPVYECPRTIHDQWSQALAENDHLKFANDLLIHDQKKRIESYAELWELAGRMAEAIDDTLDCVYDPAKNDCVLCGAFLTPCKKTCSTPGLVKALSAFRVAKGELK